MKEEIIKQLMIDSGFAKIVIHPTSPTGTHVSIDPEIQKKAVILCELVLKECINMVNKKTGEQISKHFGVK